MNRNQPLTYLDSDCCPVVGDWLRVAVTGTTLRVGDGAVVTAVSDNRRSICLNGLGFVESPKHFRFVRRAAPEPESTQPLDFRMSADLTGQHGAAIEVLLGGPTGLGLVLSDAVQARDALNRLIPKLQALNSLLGVE